MKIKPEDLQEMRQLLGATIYGAASMRHRWNAWRLATDRQSHSGVIPTLSSRLYRYLDDSNIDTALRHLAAERHTHDNSTHTWCRECNAEVCRLCAADWSCEGGYGDDGQQAKTVAVCSECKPTRIDAKKSILEQR